MTKAERPEREGVSTMTTLVPDERGMYWAETHDGDWALAYVDDYDECVFLYHQEKPTSEYVRLTFDEAAEYGIKRWFGPFHCPGGDFGQTTIEVEADMHNKAAREGNAIVLTHVDYRHVPDHHGASVTIMAVMPCEEADEYVKREATT